MKNNSRCSRCYYQEYANQHCPNCENCKYDDKQTMKCKLTKMCSLSLYDRDGTCKEFIDCELIDEEDEEYDS